MLGFLARLGGHRLIGDVEVHGGWVAMHGDFYGNGVERARDLDLLLLAEISDRADLDFVLAERQLDCRFRPFVSGPPVDVVHGLVRPSGGLQGP